MSIAMGSSVRQLTSAKVLSKCRRKVTLQMDSKVGMLLKEEREKQGLSKRELAKRSGVSRTYIMMLEQGQRQGRTSSDLLVKLANALKISPKPFLDAIGLSYEEPDLPELNRVKLARVPVYDDYPHRSGVPMKSIDYVHREFSQGLARAVEGWRVQGNSMTPEIISGDIVIIDKNGAIDNGDIIACVINSEPQLARVRKVAGDLWIENNYGKFTYDQCLYASPVIEINRRLK